MPNILRTEPAKRDLTQIWLHFALDNPTAADRLIDRIEQKLIFWLKTLDWAERAKNSPGTCAATGSAPI